MNICGLHGEEMNVCFLILCIKIKCAHLPEARMQFFAAIARSSAVQ